MLGLLLLLLLLFLCAGVLAERLSGLENPALKSPADAAIVQSSAHLGSFGSFGSFGSCGDTGTPQAEYSLISIACIRPDLTGH